jgi:hypothetical protein
MAFAKSRAMRVVPGFIEPLHEYRRMRVSLDWYLRATALAANLDRFLSKLPGIKNIDEFIDDCSALKRNIEE